MKEQAKIVQFPTASAVYFAAGAISNLISGLPTGTDYFIGVVLVVMMTGQLSQCKGSLARAVFPFVCHLKWGWHRVERALERGKVCVDKLFDIGFEYSLRELEAEVVKLGSKQREVQAIDTSTIARFRAVKRLGGCGKAYWGRAGKAVRANIVAAVVSIVLIDGIRMGIVRRTRFAASCEEAIKKLFSDLPECQNKRLIVVDAGIATKEQFEEATKEAALMGRLRSNVRLRLKPEPRKGRFGPHPKHGAVFHPGADFIETDPSDSFWIEEEGRAIRVRRWDEVHFEEKAKTILDVVRVDDPKYDKPLMIGSTARELTTEEFLLGYKMRSCIETNFYVGQDSCAMEQPRAFTEKAVTRRISLALLCGCLMKAIAACCEPIALGPWDRKPQRTAGRLANFLSQQAVIFSRVALEKVSPRNYRKNQNAKESEDLELKQAA
jgi:hypothetical protein